MVYNMFFFGWKVLLFIYQLVGMCVIVYLRRFVFQNILYIDDRFVVCSGSDSEYDELVMMDVNRLVYVLVELLIRLGYILLIGKCLLVLFFCKKYFGFFDFVRQVYIF